jgi:hypothetical protein
MRFLTFLLLFSSTVHAFLGPQLQPQQRSVRFAKNEKEVTVQLVASLDDEKVTKLFAWISRAFAGDDRYNDLMTALAAVFPAVFVNVPDLKALMDDAMARLPDENEAVGAPYGRAAREEASMGAMGAAQVSQSRLRSPERLVRAGYPI